MDNKAKTMQDAKQKAERLRDEAKALLKDAQDKMQRLAGKCVGDAQRLFLQFSYIYISPNSALIHYMSKTNGG